MIRQWRPDPTGLGTAKKWLKMRQSLRVGLRQSIQHYNARFSSFGTGAMMISAMLHLALRTAHLARTIAFYERMVGLNEVARPPNIKFPGAWLALGTPSADPIIHLYAGEAAISPGESLPKDNLQGVVDHLALAATGFHEIRDRLDGHRIAWRAQNSNPKNLQLFFHDPNGLKIELSFDPAAEPGMPISLAQHQIYRAAERFFVADQYLQFDAKATAV
jgi:catechol 2,3-dioxygenase-like lactoylglutathione lyase family enzyme